MIYLFDRMDTVAERFIMRVLPLLPPSRRAKAMRYKRNIDRDLCVMAYCLLLYGLKREYGIDEAPVFSYRENGKPCLAGYPGVFFNLSHCEAGVVCAISDIEVGIDIQNIQPGCLDIARNVCTNEELKMLERSEDPEGVFHGMWTVKESYTKQTGCGLTEPLNLLSAGALIEQGGDRVFVYRGNEYYICCFGETRCEKISQPELEEFVLASC